MDRSTRDIHVLCLPMPAPTHISAMLKLAKILYCKGFHITFVNTEINHKRMLGSSTEGGSGFLDNLPPGFEFSVIPDGLPSSIPNAAMDPKCVCEAAMSELVAPVSSLVQDLTERPASHSSPPPLTCIVTDGLMLFTACPAGRKFGIPVLNLFPISAAALMGLMQFPKLLEKGLIPLKDETYLTNGYLDMTVDRIPGMKNARLRDISGLIRTTDPDDIIFNFAKNTTVKAGEADATIIHTFDVLEKDVLEKDVLDAIPVLSSKPVYAIGPFQPLLDRISENDIDNSLKNIGCNFWKEDKECIQWLDSQKTGSVLYINFGTVVFLTKEQLEEFAYGIASSNHPFLWVLRPDLMIDDTAILPPDFIEKTKGIGYMCGWCPQEEVLNHDSVGGFLTQCGWNSTIKSLTAGVPMLCWPFYGDHPTYCKYICTEWNVGLEIDSNVKRGNVERLVRELMDGEKGKQLKKRAMEWKELAIAATEPGGSSWVNLDKLVKNVRSMAPNHHTLSG